MTLAFLYSSNTLCYPKLQGRMSKQILILHKLFIVHGYYVSSIKEFASTLLVCRGWGTGYRLLPT